MDFLDPRKRRSHKIRLFIGYFLVSIAIGLATIILVYGAYGYGIDTKTGEIVQNGLLFLDSKPGGAEIYLNGTDQKSTTSARLILQAGNYTMTLKKSGYRDWQRTFSLDEHSVARYVYPLLFPTTPLEAKLKDYTSAPALVTETPDQHWLLVQDPDSSDGTITFHEYDTSNLTRAVTTPVNLTLPTSVLSDSGASSQLSVVEWSTDNNHVLLKHTLAGGDEYIVFNRDKPADSFNVNKMFSVSPSQVALRNKKIDQLYIYSQSAGTVQLGDTGKGTLADPLLSQVLAFKPYGTDLMTYVTDKNAADGMVQARIWNNGQTYPLYTFKAGTQYLIDAAQYSGHWYYVAGSNAEQRVNVYEDPLNSLKNPSVAKAVPLLALNELGATKLGFSTNARFIEVESGQNFAVYDAETQSNYNYSLQAPLAAPMSWMDGHRLIGESAGQVFVMDYDATNQQSLVGTIEPSGGLFSHDYNHLLTFDQKDGATELMNVDMRAGTDLPKQ